MIQLPKMYHVTQTFQRPTVKDSATAARQELVRLGLDKKIAKGTKIGITVGSRGIQNLIPMLRTVVGFVKGCGAEPFLLAAMGSHGGGSEKGQKEVLDSLGITEDELGAKVLTCADSEVISQTSGGLPVFIVKSALTLDGIIIVNRVKTHTSFKAKVESGLIKKLVVGLGGPKGAQQFHSFGQEELPRLLVEIGQVILNKLPVLGGLAIIENAYEETALVQGVDRDNLIEKEAELLIYSKSLMPSLPADVLDLLIIREMGKNFSGTGVDTNIIGRARIHGVPEPSKPDIKRIAVLDLSEESHGNATGVGLVDFITKKMVDKMDRPATYLNCLTSTFVVRAAIPMYFDTEEKLMEAALYSLCSIPADKLRLAVIPNTLFLADCLVSEALVPELRNRPAMTVSEKPEEFKFDSEGKITLRI
jgi:hypothetical protein